MSFKRLKSMFIWTTPIFSFNTAHLSFVLKTNLKPYLLGLVITEDNLCNHEPKMLNWQKENYASKQTLPHVGHTFSVYKGLALSLVAAGTPWAKQHHHVCSVQLKQTVLFLSQWRRGWRRIPQNFELQSLPWWRT